MSVPASVPTRRSSVLIIILVMLLPAVLRAAASQPHFIRHGGAVPSEYIVVLSSDTPGERVDAIAAALARDYPLKVMRTYHAALPGFHCRASAAVAQRLAKDPRVAFVEENFKGQLSPIASPMEAAQCSAVKGWTLDRIFHRTGLPADANYWNPHGSGGKDVVAFVLDTGVLAAHEQFDHRIPLGHNAIRNDHGDAYATNPCSEGSDVGQVNATHGTGTASLLGGNTMGVAPEVTIVPVRVVPCNGEWLLGDVLDGLDWVVGPDAPAHPKGAVLNMSFEGPLTDLPPGQAGSLQAALGSVAGSGIVAFTVAGNWPYPKNGTPVGSGNACDGMMSQFGYGNGFAAPHVIVTSGINTDKAREFG